MVALYSVQQGSVSRSPAESEFNGMDVSFFFFTSMTVQFVPEMYTEDRDGPMMALWVARCKQTCLFTLGWL